MGAMQVQEGSITQDQEGFSGRGDLYSPCSRHTGLLEGADCSPLQGISLSVPSGPNAFPSPLTINSHASSGLDINTTFSERFPLTSLLPNLSGASCYFSFFLPYSLPL